jgi:large subunit ribosomal protein L11
MAKAIKKQLKLVIAAGKANPAPPVGPALGQAQVNIGEFVKRFNDGTKAMGNDMIPVVIRVYEDRTFDLTFKTPPASDLIMKALKIEKGSGKNKTAKVGTITKAQVKAIAERKMPDLNANDIEAAMKIIEGSARSMGVDVK